MKYFNRKDSLLMVLATAINIGQCYFYLRVPGCLSDITTLLSIPGTTVDDVVMLSAKMVASALISLVLGITTYVICAYVSSDVSARIRAQVFDKVMTFSEQENSKFNVSTLITRTTNDVNQIQPLISTIFPAISQAIFTLAMALWMIYSMRWEWLFAVAAVSESVICMFLLCMTYVAPKYDYIQKNIDKICAVMREKLKGARVIRSYNAEKFIEERYAAANGLIRDTNISAARITTLIGPYTDAMVSFVSITVYAIGFFLILSSDIPERLGLFSNMIVVASYGSIVIQSFIIVVYVAMMMPRANASLRRIDEVMDLDVSVKSGPISETNGECVLEFRNVSYMYSEKDGYVLKDISFRARKGEMIAFIGDTGCGKTTLMNLIPRFMDPTDGCILFDNKDIREYDLDFYREKIGFATQQPVLFEGTVDHNIRLGRLHKVCNTEDMDDALRISCSYEFVKDMGGTMSRLVQRGSNLSGGQRQRLSIARSVVSEPEIFIFDDSFSALDFKTESIIRETVCERDRYSTFLISSQRIGSVMNADCIHYMEQGRIIASGSHDDLMEKCPGYKRIVDAQLGGRNR